MKYFFDIDLDEIKEEHLVGAWTIEDRFVNNNKHADVFLNCINLVLLDNGVFETLHCDELTGLWTMMREVELIYNPQVIFFNGEQQMAKAIVTRLFTDNSVYKLTLYFSTGLELNLRRERDTPKMATQTSDT